ncbi:hypothetical protein GCM10023178_01870 [Actinomadura luteofluorescens]
MTLPGVVVDDGVVDEATTDASFHAAVGRSHGSCRRAGAVVGRRRGGAAPWWGGAVVGRRSYI